MGFFRRAYCVPYGGRGPPLKYQLQTDDPSRDFLSRDFLSRDRQGADVRERVKSSYSFS